MSNYVHVSGFVGNDPKIRETDIGKVGIFQIANHDNRKSDKPVWIPVVAFGDKVDMIVTQIKSGMNIDVEGRLRMREAKDGTRYLEVEALFLKNVAKWEKRNPSPEGGRRPHLDPPTLGDQIDPILKAKLNAAGAQSEAPALEPNNEEEFNDIAEEKETEESEETGESEAEKAERERKERKDQKKKKHR